MIEGGWLQVFQRIPADYYDTLSLISVTGAELVVQQMFRIERDFVVVRARTAGTLDGGRVILIPYSQIDFLMFNRKISEEEVGKIFNAPFQSFAAAAPSVAAAGLAATPLPGLPAQADLPPLPLVETASETEEASEEAVTSAPKPNQVSKSVLLARLRERLADKTR